MTLRLQAWFWCLLLVAVTTIPSDVSASNLDTLWSTLDKIVPERVRFWRTHVPSDDVIASTNVPSGDVDASTVDDAALVDGSDELDDVVDCSESGTCDTGNMYDGDEGEKKEQDVDVEEECVDNQESCEAWASTGECEKNPAFMTENCKKSCLLCPITEIDTGVKS
jgi:hypothetical protein